MGKHYDKDFKMQTARLVVEGGRRITELSKEMDISSKSLSRWVSTYKDKKDAGFIGSGNLNPEKKTESDLEKRIRDLEEENAILKKAMHIFTRSQI